MAQEVMLEEIVLRQDDKTGSKASLPACVIEGIGTIKATEITGRERGQPTNGRVRLHHLPSLLQ